MPAQRGREIGASLLDAVKTAESGGDVFESLGVVPDCFEELGEGKVPEGAGFARGRKIAILSKAYGICTSIKQRPRVRHTGEAWERPQSASTEDENRIHEIIVSEFMNLLQFYMSRVRKTNRPLNAELIATIAENVKGGLGKKLSYSLTLGEIPWFLAKTWEMVNSAFGSAPG